MFIDHRHETYAEFYHGDYRYANKDGNYEPPYDGVDTLILYTLTPEVTSSFKDIRICEAWCNPSDEFLYLKSAMGRFSKIHILLCVLI